MKFTKMQGIGNDYVYVNCLQETIENPSELAKKISDRHYGVGSDGLIMINPSDKADFEMEMYNADGSRGEMCGNGIRCVAKYVYDYGLTDKTSISVETLAGTLGTVIGAAAGLLFLLFVLWIFKGGIRRQIQRDHTKGKESYSHILKILVMTAIPVIFSTAIYNINQILDLTVFNHIMDAQGFTESEYMALQGIYTGKYDPLINVPMSIPYALSTSIVPALTTVVMARNRKKTHYQIDQTLRLTTIITLPSCVGFLVLASPLMVLLYNDAGKVPAQLLMLGSVVIILYGWSTITNAVLQGLNYLSSPAKNAAAALVVHLGALVLMLTVFKLNVYALVGSNIVFAVIMCVLNQRKIRQVCGFRINIRRTFVKPLIASAIMGVITYAVHFGLHRLIGGRVIPTVLAIIVAVIVYGVLILKLGALSEKDIQALPMGTRILRGCQALKLMPPSEE